MAERKGVVGADRAKGFVVRVREQGDKGWEYKTVSRLFSVKDAAYEFLKLYQRVNKVEEGNIWVTDYA